MRQLLMCLKKIPVYGMNGWKGGMGKLDYVVTDVNRSLPLFVDGAECVV